jgi:hypothetical protein
MQELTHTTMVSNRRLGREIHEIRGRSFAKKSATRKPGFVTINKRRL